MRRASRPVRIAIRAGFAAGTLAAAAALAQSSGGAYVLERHTIDGGGGRSTGGAYALDGTIGQPDAQAAATGGSYRLAGGFWVAAVEPGGDALFADGFE